MAQYFLEFHDLTSDHENFPHEINFSIIVGMATYSVGIVIDYSLQVILFNRTNSDITVGFQLCFFPCSVGINAFLWFLPTQPCY